VGDDDEKLFQILKERITKDMENRRKEAERLHRLQNSDILDVEAQK